MCKLFLNAVYSAIVALIVGAPVCGAPSGLNVIPTADVLDKGIASVEMESDGIGRPWGGGCDRFALLQAGIGRGVELGVDRCLDDSDTWVNFKWRARGESGSLPAIALGLQTISEGDRPQPYIATTKSLGLTRLHVGAVDVDGVTRWMLGIDRPLCKLVTFQADNTSGDENSSTYGVAINLSNSLSLTLARSIGNTADTGNGHIINLAWSAAWK
ncbi:MAG: YjbH domain-containing protein [Armatimonadetes bacterium]|nr:YjbH domain-containing protein [Armatimonadota bacterium]